MREGDAGKREQLHHLRSLTEILEVAISFEQAAARFYRDLLGEVSKPLRWVVKCLAQEEEEHEQKLRDLRRNPELQQMLQSRIQVPSTDPKFSDAVQTPELEQLVDDQAVLQYALSREQLAMEQYRGLAESTPAGEIQDLFQWLADEEIEHKKELEKRYYQLIHRGGGV